LNNIVIKRRGGTTTVNLDGEIAFQQKRVDLLKWAETATITKAETNIEQIAQTIAKNENVTIEVGRSQTWIRNPQLYADYMQEKA